ncbi:MAG: DUF2290 domain-containing protein [Bryobacterales bacterium]|nr:DUF2290 domain-containing protein [Bryobacterales bacterium]
MEELKLLRPPMRFHRKPSEEFRKVALRLKAPYVDVFRTGLEQQDYCFLLDDYSFFQLFHAEGARGHFAVRYAFYPNPFPYVSLEDFLDDLGLPGSDPEAMEFYHQYLSEQSGVDGFGPFRYEVDFDAHRPLRHPCAHLHVGHQTRARIPLDKILSPKAFVLFMTKCHFPEAWCASDKTAGVPNALDHALKTEKASCPILEDEHFEEAERGELFLT